MKENKGKKRWGLMLFIVLIMIGTSFSVFLYGGSPANEVVRYNDIKFVGNGQMWTAKINERKAAFSFLPQEVEDIPVNGSVASLLQNRLEIDVTSDFNSTFKEQIASAQYQMGLTLSAYGIYMRQGFTKNSTYNAPVMTCKDATSNVPVISFKNGSSTRIDLDGSCIIAEASSNQDFIRVKDKLLYLLLGVLDE
ncbi:hypothetical protein HYT92_00820 [Candidatus Pacearchaeota archaeon]|nr:hypothetical protein [Candidatus Pacearchaeota archaeon]